MKINQDLEEDDRELIMGLEPLYQRDREQAVQKGEQRLIIRLLNCRIAEIDASLIERVRGLPIEQLENLGEALLDFSTVADLQAWLNDDSEENKNKEHTNIKLIYDYTKDWLKSVNDSINNLNTKSGSLLAFCGIAVGFSINLPNGAFLLNDSIKQYFCYSCLILKILVCICLIVGIFASTSGFLPKAGGGMTPPDLLMKENYYDLDKNIRLIITKTSIEALAELESLRDCKAKFVSSAIIALAGAAFFAAIDVILASIVSII